MKGKRKEIKKKAAAVALIMLLTYILFPVWECAEASTEQNTSEENGGSFWLTLCGTLILLNAMAIAAVAFLGEREDEYQSQLSKKEQNESK